MRSKGDWPEETIQKADLLAAESESDVLFFNADTTRETYTFTQRQIEERKQRCRQVFAIIVSQGGDPDAAYLIARLLLRRYARVVACVPGWCKSAGTLLVLGAHELVVGDDGELGPLDVQIPKRDELFDVGSGLTATDALDALGTDALETWKKLTYDITEWSSGRIRFKSASEIAVGLTTGFYAPIFAQIDPINVGELHRLMNIAREYGQRLARQTRIISSHCLEHLLTDYPHHGFVIDREEAGDLFKSVRAPKEAELELLDALGSKARDPLEDFVIGFISNEIEQKRSEVKSNGATATSSTGDGARTTEHAS